MYAWLLPLLLAAAPLGAESTMCRPLREYRGKIQRPTVPSMENIVNCGAIGDISSNYLLPTDPNAPVELHVVSVHAGSLPSYLTKQGERGAGKAVRVIVYETEKPAIILLNAHQPVVWNLTLTKKANVEQIVLQGTGSQELRGVPKSIPVITREKERICARAHGWEPKFNRHGANYALMIRSIRCATGLRETSFQGCATGGVFEIPHYRKENGPNVWENPTSSCPIDLEPDIQRPWVEDYATDYLGKEQKTVLAAEPPAAPPPLPTEEELPAPRGVPERPDIPARALAILLDGDHSMSTFDAIPDLMIALERGNARLRSRAADELGKMGSKSKPAVKKLIERLRKDENLRVRASAALALGNIGLPAEAAVRHLKKALRSDNANLRLSAEKALERIGTPRARKILRKYRGK